MMDDIPVEFLQSNTPFSPAGNGGDLSMAESEKRSILKALGHTDGNRSLAARELGISRNTLLNKIKRYGLE